MASAQVALAKNVWTKVTTTDKAGSIRHQEGNTAVVYTESATTPPAFDVTTPVMESTIKGQDWAYFSVGASDFVWAYAVSASAVITVSPGSA